MLQSYHQNAEQFEILFNKDKYNALPAKMKAIIENAVEAASADMSWKSIDRYSKDYIGCRPKDKVKFYKTPDADPAKAARNLRPDRGEEVGREPPVQGDHRIADSICQARGGLGYGYQRRPAHGL